MEQSKLNREIRDNFEDFGFYGESLILESAANVAEKFVREISLEYPLWLQQNRWFNYVDGKWRHTFEQGTTISKASYEKNFTKTNEELFNLFLEKKYGRA